MQSSKQVSCMIKFTCRKLTLIISWKNYLRGWQKDQCCNNEVWWTVKYSVKYAYIFLPQWLEKLFFLSLHFNKLSLMTEVSPASTDFSSIQGNISFLPSLPFLLPHFSFPPSLPSFLYFSLPQHIYLINTAQSSIFLTLFCLLISSVLSLDL